MSPIYLNDRNYTLFYLPFYPMKNLLITLIFALLALLLSPGVEFRFGGEEK